MRKLREKFRKRRPPPVVPFNFRQLPVELKHEVLAKLKTGYLIGVCSKVCRQWGGMVSDIVNVRSNKIDRLIPAHIRPELEKQTPPDLENGAVEMLKFYERSKLSKKFDVTAIRVNEDALKNSKGIVFHLWKSRPCDCSLVDQCIVQTVGIMNAMSLLIVKAAEELQFFHLRDFERLNDPDTARELRPYQCINFNTNSSQTWFRNSATTDISVFRDQLVVEESPKTILLLKVLSCEHENRRIIIQRRRRIHLPLESRSLCLLEDKLFVLYSTGDIGEWDRNKDDLSISDVPILRGLAENSALHNSKMYRVASLVFVKYRRNNNPCEWYVHDPESDDLEFHAVPMAIYTTGGFLVEDPSWECTEVFYIELWCNFFIVHCQVQSLIDTKGVTTEDRLLIKRVKKSPTLTDFMSQDSFCQKFLVGTCVERAGTTILNGTVISTFLPLSLKPWQLEPKTTEPIPVADMVAIEWPAKERKRRRKLRVYRVRISNLPLKG